MKMLLLSIHGLFYVLFELLSYAMSGFLVVPYEFMGLYQSFSLGSLIFMALAQFAILCVPRESARLKFGLQLLTFVFAGTLESLVILYADNAASDYPVWSDFAWLVVLAVTVVAVMGVLCRQLAKKPRTAFVEIDEM